MEVAGTRPALNQQLEELAEDALGSAGLEEILCYVRYVSRRPLFRA